MARNRSGRDTVVARREKERRTYGMWVRGATYAEVAATIDPATGQPMYAGVSGAREAVRRAAATLAPDDDVETLRTQLLGGLMAHLLECNRIAGRTHPLLDRAGQPVLVPQTGPDGVTRNVTVDDDDVRIRAIREARAISARIATLMGLDAATKWEVAGPSGGPIEVEAVRDSLLDRMANIRLLPTPPAIEAAAAELPDHDRVHQDDDYEVPKAVRDAERVAWHERTHGTARQRHR
jgi:hypothetical protein